MVELAAHRLARHGVRVIDADAGEERDRETRQDDQRLAPGDPALPDGTIEQEHEAECDDQDRPLAGGDAELAVANARLAVDQIEWVAPTLVPGAKTFALRRPRG